MIHMTDKLVSSGTFRGSHLDYSKRRKVVFDLALILPCRCGASPTGLRNSGRSGYTSTGEWRASCSQSKPSRMNSRVLQTWFPSSPSASCLVIARAEQDLMIHGLNKSSQSEIGLTLTAVPCTPRMFGSLHKGITQTSCLLIARS